MRTFVAVELDPDVKDSLVELTSRLSRRPADIKWVKKQGMHITLKFLGEVAETQIPEIVQALHEACDSFVSFPISIRGMGFFPPHSPLPRILWVGIDQSRALSVLQEKIEDKLNKQGFPREKRQFRPHLTLGRVRSGKNISGVLQDLNDHRESDFGQMQVKKVTLFKSTLKPTGADYERLSEIKLT